MLALGRREGETVFLIMLNKDGKPYRDDKGNLFEIAVTLVESNARQAILGFTAPRDKVCVLRAEIKQKFLEKLEKGEKT